MQRDRVEAGSGSRHRRGLPAAPAGPRDRPGAASPPSFQKNSDLQQYILGLPDSGPAGASIPVVSSGLACGHWWCAPSKVTREVKPSQKSAGNGRKRVIMEVGTAPESGGHTRPPLSLPFYLDSELARAENSFSRGHAPEEGLRALRTYVRKRGAYCPR